MSVGSVFRLTALLAFGAGAAWMLATESILALLGAEPDAVLVFVARQPAEDPLQVAVQGHGLHPVGHGEDGGGVGAHPEVGRVPE